MAESSPTRCEKTTASGSHSTAAIGTARRSTCQVASAGNQFHRDRPAFPGSGGPFVQQREVVAAQGRQAGQHVALATTSRRRRRRPGASWQSGCARKPLSDIRSNDLDLGFANTQ